MSDYHPQENRRRFDRRRALKGATIAYSDRNVTMPCVVRDISDGGARLQVENASEVPDTFDLLVALDGLEASSKVVWRDGKEVGIQYIAKPSYTVPKRTQVVTESETHKRASLLKKPLQADADVESPEDSKPQSRQHKFWVYVAEDDPDDQMLLREAFEESGYSNILKFFADGKMLLDYLHSDEGRKDGSLRGMILLDLNMPRMDGRETLRQLKAHPDTRGIPVVVLTTSNAERDIEDTFKLGVSLYYTKPSSFGELKELVETLEIYWSGKARIPARNLTPSNQATA